MPSPTLTKALPLLLTLPAVSGAYAATQLSDWDALRTEMNKDDPSGEYFFTNDVQANGDDASDSIRVKNSSIVIDARNHSILGVGDRGGWTSLMVSGDNASLTLRNLGDLGSYAPGTKLSNPDEIARGGAGVILEKKAPSMRVTAEVCW